MSDNLYNRAEERVDKKLRFYRNLQAYIMVNALLAAINWFFTPEFWWVLFPVFFWGLGVLKDFLMHSYSLTCSARITGSERLKKKWQD